MALVVLLGIVALVALLAIGWRQVGRSRRETYWEEGKPGSIWFHGPTGDVVPEDDEFKRPPDEGGLL